MAVEAEGVELDPTPPQEAQASSEADAPSRRPARSTLRRASAPDAEKPATIYDVAREAGVSHQTVTRYLNGFEGIRPATRERVAEALRRLDYRPNLTARSLTTGRSHRIGALTHEIDQFGPSKIIQGATAAARDAGFVLDIVTLDMGSPQSIAEALDLLRLHDLAGILALSSTDEMTQAFEAAEFSVPVYIGAEQDDLLSGHPTELSTVGLPALIDYLSELGHTRFVHIAGPMAWSAARNRAHAFEAAVAHHGLTPRRVLHGDWSARSGYEAIRALGSSLDATAVIAANDQMALGAMLALAEAGLDVPGDVSVTGIDDVPEAAYYAPPLTTLRMDFAAQGRVAVRNLIRRITNEESSTEAPPAPQLVVRRSTGPAAS